MKPSDELMFLFCGLILLIPIQGYAVDTFDEEFDYLKETEHEPGSNERSQSISHADNFEHYKSLEGTVHPKLARLRTVRSESKITLAPDYISPDSVDLNLPRYRRATKDDAKADYDNTYQRFLNENFPKQDHDPLTSKNSKYTAVKLDTDNGNAEADRQVTRLEAYKTQKQKHGDNNDKDVEEYHPTNYEFKYPSDEYERIKYLSDQQAKEIKKNPGNCQLVIKKNMECQVCNDPKTGANSESCSYSSNPDHQKYAYLRERSYDSKKDPERNGDGGKKSAGANKNGHKKSAKLRNTKTPQQAGPVGHARDVHEAEESRPQRDVIGLDPFLYGSSADFKKGKEEPKSFESYYSHVFPNGNKKSESLKQASDDEAYEFTPEYQPNKDVDKVLAEFSKKDWSKCSKTAKGALTCYQCKDKNGVNYEECMYISDNNPKKSRLVYEESKRFYEDGKSKNPAAAAVPQENLKQADGGEDDYSDEDSVEDSDKETSNIETTITPLVSTLAAPKMKKILVRKTVINNKDDLSPENLHENDGASKRTFKRTISYKIEANGSEDLPKRSIEYKQQISHST